MSKAPLELNPIGVIRSEFPEKFGVPKQPGLAPFLRAVLELTGEWAHESSLRGLSECSHLWVIFHFHLNQPKSGVTVRPPVLGGQERVGVWATRSPHRPNPLGLSLVKLEKVLLKEGVAQLHVSGHDFVDGTPLIDIKPYVASYDTPEGDTFHWSDKVSQAPLEVVWKGQALIDLEALGRFADKALIDQVLRLDPRPRSAKADASFGMSFAGLNITFHSEDGSLVVSDIETLKS